MTFDRANLRVLNADIQAALTEVGKKHGITIALGTGRFSPNEYRSKITATTSAPVDAAVRARKEFEEYAGAFFLKPSDFGQTFVVGGKQYTICGIKPKSRQYPVLGRNARGKVFKFAASDVLTWFGRKEDARNASIGMAYRGLDAEARAEAAAEARAQRMAARHED